MDTLRHRRILEELWSSALEIVVIIAVDNEGPTSQLTLRWIDGIILILDVLADTGYISLHKR